MYKNLKFIVLIGILTLLLQFFMYYIALALLVVLPVLLSGNSCGIHSDTQLCQFVSTHTYQAFIQAFSVLISAYVAIFVIGKLIKNQPRLRI